MRRINLTIDIAHVLQNGTVEQNESHFRKCISMFIRFLLIELALSAYPLRKPRLMGRSVSRYRRFFRVVCKNATGHSGYFAFSSSEHYTTADVMYIR